MNATTMNAEPTPVQPLDAPDRIGQHGVQAASTLDTGRRWLGCPQCGLDSGPYSTGEAGQLGGTHDDLIHRGRPTALVLAGGAA
jgi:hypothetical protein